MKRIFIVLLTLFLCTTAFPQILKKDLKDIGWVVDDTKIFFNEFYDEYGNRIYPKYYDTTSLEKNVHCDDSEIDVKYSAAVSDVFVANECINGKYIIEGATHAILVYDPWEETIYIFYTGYKTKEERDFWGAQNPSWFWAELLDGNIIIEYKDLYRRGSSGNDKIYPYDKQKDDYTQMEVDLHGLIFQYLYYNDRDGNFVDNVGYSEEIEGYKYIKRIVCTKNLFEDVYYPVVGRSRPSKPKY